MQEVEGPTTYSDVKSGRYSLTVRLDQIPRCPICGRTLCGQVTRIRCSVAFCDGCFKVHPVIIANHLSALLLPELIASQTNLSGMIFWCPKHPQWTNLQSVLDALAYRFDLRHDTAVMQPHPDGDHAYYLDLHRHTLDFLPGTERPPHDINPAPPPVSNPNTVLRTPTRFRG